MLGNGDVPQLGCTVREAPAGNALRTLVGDGRILIMLGNEDVLRSGFAGRQRWEAIRYGRWRRTEASGLCSVTKTIRYEARRGTHGSRYARE